MISFLCVRKCNSSLLEESIDKLSEIFFARNHPIYQNIIFHRTLDQIAMPEELFSFLEENVSSSQTNTVEKCQGTFLEEINKESKSWLKLAGIPSNEQWTEVFRNLDKMNKVSLSLLNIVIKNYNRKALRQRYK